MRANWSRADLIHNEYFNLTGDTGRDFDNPAYSVNLADDPCCSDHAAQLRLELQATVETWY